MRSCLVALLDVTCVHVYRLCVCVMCGVLEVGVGHVCCVVYGEVCVKCTVRMVCTYGICDVRRGVYGMWAFIWLVGV